MVEEFAALVEKEAAEKALPVEKEKEVPVVEKEVAVPAKKKKEDAVPAKTVEVDKKKAEAAMKKESTPAKKTRPQVFLDIMEAGGGTKQELIATMKEKYAGSDTEATYQVGMFISVLTVFGVLAKDDTGKITKC